MSSSSSTSSSSSSSHSTPTRAAPTSSSSRSRQAPTTSTTPTQPFTPTMRDRQSRGKDPSTGLDIPFGESSASSANPDSSARDSRGSRNLRDWREDFDERRVSLPVVEGDAYVEAEKRRWAAEVLDSPELLEMWALEKGESVPRTRYYFTQILCGYEPGMEGKDRSGKSDSEKGDKKNGREGKKKGRGM